MTSNPPPANGQTWQSRFQPGRTITLTAVGPTWTHFIEDQEQTPAGAPKPGWIQTRGLAQHYRPTA